MKTTSKRRYPTEDVLDWRKMYLQQLNTLSADSVPVGTPTGLSPGNSKIGASGTKYETGFVWNLPAVASCPGASAWCKRACYNADPRTDKFPIEEWLQNWCWAVYAPDQLQRRISSQLREASGKTAVRIHSSGDFFSVSYIEFWKRIVEIFPDVDFWAYTRSWAVKELLPALDELRSNNNCQLFASVDSSQSEAPDNWRKSHVTERLLDGTWIGDALNCPEQVGKVENCLSCGYCMSRSVGDVVFVIH